MNLRKLIITVALLVAVALGGAAVGTAQAHSLRVAHVKPFSKMTLHQREMYLKRQIWKDKSAIRFWKNHHYLIVNNPPLAHVYNEQTHWAKVSLRITEKNLHKLLYRPRYFGYSSSTYSSGSVQQIICSVFGSACSEAEIVAKCESGYSTTATNGQYYGIFQMGTNERAKYATIGYSTPYEQIVAAHNYYVAAGWGPWQCA